ncbi:gamma-secretase aspartyl protease complex, presenilin enhancer-2 subunit [Halteromyces radiatus]|uniref:gamma-secretase aspartyl protease complex, presenilin enhancer-2 subunit n=1 Tax=Halteromyces radiatus TaxID=101107 RepID=UPI0022202AF9|nr:gamma-secretase aspartyl protease complex, presenilin enhancer-2 subunit [Halteromyces radiatus]KAI8083174.1 gamma-secretase aspartyl protease complex, presenilin enhancer-2 subunit [Halteromyces radiatus]
MPKLDKLGFDEMIIISKKMFYGGFAFLPFLWLVNFLYFFQQTRKPSAPKQLKHYVYLSLGGCLLWFIVLTTWYGIFVNERTYWGALGDKLTVVIPKGS